MILYTIERVQLSNFNDSKKIKANPSTLVYQVEVQDQINMQAVIFFHQKLLKVPTPLFGTLE